MSGGPRTAFWNLAPEKYPLTVRLWAADAAVDGAPTWSCVAAEPGIMSVPALGPGTRVQIVYGDGTEQRFP